MSTQHEHHPFQHLIELLDSFDHKVDALRHDVAGGIHDAIFDEASLLHAGGRPDPECTCIIRNDPALVTTSVQDCPEHGDLNEAGTERVTPA